MVEVFAPSKDQDVAKLSQEASSFVNLAIATGHTDVFGINAKIM
jgi:hypothetical protein